MGYLHGLEHSILDILLLYIKIKINERSETKLTTNINIDVIN